MQPQPQPSGSDEVLDLRDYLGVLRRQSLIIGLAAFVGLAAALGYSVMQPPTYAARAEVLVRPPVGTTSAVRIDQLISIDTEARLVTSAPIADIAKRTLRSRLTVLQLLDHVTVQTTPDTLILDIIYRDGDPDRAAAGANAFADAYLEYKRQSALDQIAAQRAELEQQIAQLRRQEREQARALDSATPGTPAYQSAQDALDRIQVQIAVLASQIAATPGVVDPGAVILPATPPSRPASPKHPLNAGIGMFFGTFLGIVLAFLRDRADDRVHDRRDLRLYVQAPIFAYVPHVPRRSRHGTARLVVQSEPRSPAAEAYRTARTSVLSLAGRRGAKVIAVVSPAQGEGKSTSAANLAAALGHADRRVVVVSADLRKPTIHEHFGVSPSKGLSEVLTGELSLEEAVRRSFSPNVWVLASGRIPAHPAELLQSPAMGQVIAELRETFDFVVIDCPPLLGLADSLAVVPLTDAILLVVQAERTQGGAIVEACDQLDRVGGRVEGVILNDIRAQRGWPGHRGYGYYLASTQYLASQEETMGTATTIRERTRSPFEERRAAAAQDAPLTAEPRSATTADDR